MLLRIEAAGPPSEQPSPHDTARSAGPLVLLIGSEAQRYGVGRFMVHPDLKHIPSRGLPAALFLLVADGLLVCFVGPSRQLPIDPLAVQRHLKVLRKPPGHSFHAAGLIHTRPSLSMYTPISGSSMTSLL